VCNTVVQLLTFYFVKWMYLYSLPCNLTHTVIALHHKYEYMELLLVQTLSLCTQWRTSVLVLVRAIALVWMSVLQYNRHNHKSTTRDMLGTLVCYTFKRKLKQLVTWKLCCGYMFSFILCIQYNTYRDFWNFWVANSVFTCHLVL